MRLRPTRRRTWAPAGHPPLIPSRDTHDRLSALATRTLSPKRQPRGLDGRCPPHHCQAVKVADVLRALWRHRRGHVLLLWAQGAIHQGPAIEAVQKAFPRRHGEEFPADAPELNPVEQVWNDFQGQRAHSLPRDQRDIRRSLDANTRRVRRYQATRRSFILASKRPSPP